MINAHLDEDDQLMVDPLFRPVLVSPNKMRFYSGPISGPEYTVTDSDEEGVFGQILDLLVDGCTPHEIINRIDSKDEDSVLELIVGLYDAGVITKIESGSSQPESTQGYLSQLTISNEFGSDDIAESEVLVCSAGFDTKSIERQLSQTEIEAVTQIQFTNAGNPELTSFPSPDELATFDVAVLLSRRTDGKVGIELSRRTRTAGIPLVAGRVDGLDAFIGPVVMPNASPCYNCFQKRLESNILNDGQYEEYIKETPRYERGPIVDIFEDFVASYLSITTIRVLSTGASFLTGASVHTDFLTTNMVRDDILPVPQCAICGVDTDRNPERQPFLTLDQIEWGEEW